MAQYASFGDGKTPPHIPEVPSDNEYGHDLHTGPLRIDGTLLSVAGLSGLSVGLCTVDFYVESLVIAIGYGGNEYQIPYSDVTALQIGGRGDVATTSGGGWSGGGIFPADLRGGDFDPLGGVGNAARSVLTGVVLSAVMNKLTTTQSHSRETIFHLAWESGSVTFLNTAQLPSMWERRLAPVFRQIESARKQWPGGGQTNYVSQAEKVCPYCAETIKAAAIKCRYCQSELS